MSFRKLHSGQFFAINPRLPKLPWCHSLQPSLTPFHWVWKWLRAPLSSFNWLKLSHGYIPLQGSLGNVARLSTRKKANVDADEQPVVGTPHRKRHCGGRGESQQLRASQKETKQNTNLLILPHSVWGCWS